MTLTARFAVASIIDIVFDLVPILRMGIESERSTSSTVAAQTYIPIGMAGLTGRQGTPRLTSMTDRPGVEIGSHGILQMALIALQTAAYPSVDSLEVCAFKSQPKTATV